MTESNHTPTPPHTAEGEGPSYDDFPEDHYGLDAGNHLHIDQLRTKAESNDVGSASADCSIQIIDILLARIDELRGELDVLVIERDSLRSNVYATGAARDEAMTRADEARAALTIANTTNANLHSHIDALVKERDAAKEDRDARRVECRAVHERDVIEINTLRAERDEERKLTDSLRSCLRQAATDTERAVNKAIRLRQGLEAATRAIQEAADYLEPITRHNLAVAMTYDHLRKALDSAREAQSKAKEM